MPRPLTSEDNIAIKHFIYRVCDLSRARNISVRQMCVEAGIHRNVVYNYNTYPSAKSLIRLSDYFGVSIDYLLKGETNED